MGVVSWPARVRVTNLPDRVRRRPVAVLSCQVGVRSWASQSDELGNRSKELASGNCELASHSCDLASQRDELASWSEELANWSDEFGNRSDESLWNWFRRHHRSRGSPFPGAGCMMGRSVTRNLCGAQDAFLL